MMLSSLTNIAEQFGLNFEYGEVTAFNLKADKLDWENYPICMYHEGYVSGSSTEDDQGAWDSSYSVRIWLLIRNSGPNDKPIDRVPRFAQLEPLMYQLLAAMEKDYQVKSPVTFSEGVNIKLADKPLDGIRFVANCVARVSLAYC